MKNLFIIFLGLLLFSACSSSSKNDGAINVDREGIRKTFFSNSRNIRDCYGQALAANGAKKLSGKVVLNFDIDENGKAKNTKLEEAKTTLKNDKLNQCLFSQVKTWNFPKPPEGKTINVIYPLAFNRTPAKNMQQKMDQYRKLKKNQDEPTKK